MSTKKRNPHSRSRTFILMNVTPCLRQREATLYQSKQLFQNFTSLRNQEPTIKVPRVRRET